MWALLARKRFGFALRLWLLRIKYALVRAEDAHVGTCAPPGWKWWASPAVFRDTTSSAGWAESMWECLLAFPKHTPPQTQKTLPPPPKKKPQIEAYVLHLKQSNPDKKIEQNRARTCLSCNMASQQCMEMTLLLWHAVKGLSCALRSPFFAVSLRRTV